MKISAMRLEALKEIGNIGTGNAATSLSALLQTRVSMEVPKVWLVSIEELEKALGELEAIRVALYLKVEGEAPGKAVFVFPPSSAEAIVQTLLRTPDPPDIFTNELAQSALQEVGNIMVSSFVVALSQFSGVRLQPSVPALGIDMVGAMIDSILLEEGEIDDNVLIIDTKLSGLEGVQGSFLYIPESGSLDKLLGVFGI